VATSRCEAERAPTRKALQNAGDAGVTRTEIYNLFSDHTKAGVIERVLMALLDQGRVSKTSEDTGGRPIERWRLVK
jgi:hypothetical protein